MLRRLFTRNLKKIPLLWIDFNLQHYRKIGREKSCMVHLHPNFRNDQYIRKTLNDLILYIRKNYNMENM